MTKALFHASIIVRWGRVYVPTLATIENTYGLVYVEPVFVANIVEDELAEALEKATAIGHPVVPVPAKQELKNGRYPLHPAAKAARATSNLAFDKGSAHYSATWYKERIDLFVAIGDSIGRVEWNATKARQLPPQTDFREVAHIILEEAAWYPSAWNPAPSGKQRTDTDWLRFVDPDSPRKVDPTRARFSASITVRQGEVFIPTLATIQGEHGLLVTEPVTVVEATSEVLARALERAYETGHPALPTADRLEARLSPRQVGPEEKAAKVKSWKAFAIGSAFYTAEWFSDSVRLRMALPDGRGRVEWSAKKVRYLAADCDFQTVAKVILEDSRWYPSAWANKRKSDGSIDLPSRDWVKTFGP